MGSACTVASYKSPGEIERENTVTSTSNYSMPEPRNATNSPHQCKPTISRKESQEGSTFGSKERPLPESERIVNASQCSMITAVTCADSDVAKSVRKTSVAACSYCGKYFDVPQLVEHVTSCKDVSRLKAEELSLKDGSPSSPLLGDADCVEDPSVGDRELCPKCRQEFSLLELIKHADECIEESFSTISDAESSLEDAKDLVESSDGEKSVENFVNNDGKDGIGGEVYGSYDSLYHDDGKGDGHFFMSDNDTCGDVDGRITEADHDVDGGSVFDDIKSDEDRDDVDVHDDVDDDESSTIEGITHRFSFGDSYHDDEHNSNISSISYTNENFEYDEGDVKGYESSSFYSENGSSDNDLDVVENSEATFGSEEFEKCPHCHEVFPLPYLVDHAHNCIGTASELNKAIKTAIATGPLSVTPPAECSIASYDCQLCGLRLPDEMMSKHYPKCERQHFGKSRSEGSSTTAESDSAVLPEHLIQMDVDQGTRLTIEDDWSVHSLAGSTTPSDKSVNREADDSYGLEWISSRYSYHDCEEQCLYCLKMFPMSMLVEHACDCVNRQEPNHVQHHSRRPRASKNSADELTELEQCCYCLQTFPLNKLINHAATCDQKAVSSSGEVLERCMHCFKDFTVSELIPHAENCTENMLGPRERLHGFMPSVHDLSAISSAAILNDTQQEALQYVITSSAQDSKSVASSLLVRVQGLGYSENDLKKTLQWVRSASPIIIHINLDKVLKFLVEDTNYRNRFETGTSGGSINMEARKSWEDRIFNKAYQSSPASERVKYGVLNIVGDPRGVKKCAQYGDSFLQLKKVRLRATFASQDTSGVRVKLSCCEHYENVLFTYTDQEITAIIDVATGKVPFHQSDCISHYKEVQIHGPVSLSENVECIVVNSRHKEDSLTTKLLDRFVEQNKCNLIWMDPDDLTGTGPFSSGATGHEDLPGAIHCSSGATSHYPSPSSLIRPTPYTRSDKSRSSYLSKAKPSFPADSKPRILSESKPRILGESEPRISYSDLKSETFGKPKPSFPSESRYRTVRESKPGFLDKSNPKILSESKPRTRYSDLKPEILGKPKPSFPSESKYKTLSETRPSLLREKKPGIRSESKPGIYRESKLRTLSDSEPRALSSSPYSYRDTGRIRPRTTATVDRRDRRSSLWGPSRRKDPYF